MAGSPAALVAQRAAQLVVDAQPEHVGALVLAADALADDVLAVDVETYDCQFPHDFSSRRPVSCGL